MAMTDAGIIRAFVDEIDALRAELAQERKGHAAALNRGNDLYIENERLTQEVLDRITEQNRLADENERLRAERSAEEIREIAAHLDPKGVINTVLGENERLVALHREMTRERDALRAEVERLHGSMGTLTQKLEFAQDENERLKTEVLRALDEPTQNEHDLYAENGRLRAALTNADAAGEALVKAGVDFAKENEWLRAALTRYGRHELLCSFFKDGEHQASPDTVCDCGLNAALKA
jgi:chromosome segregation ATPase